MGSGDGGKLLVVDDIPQNVRLLEAFLVSRGRGGGAVFNVVAVRETAGELPHA
jgi:CheY-like chemotaxis protein